MEDTALKSNKIGISTNVFKNPSNTADLIGHLAVNFDVIEIEIERSFKDALMNKDNVIQQVNQINDIRDFIKPNLKFSVHAPYIDINTDIANDSEAIRKEALKNLAFSLYFASQIGADKVTIHPGYYNDHATIKKKLPQLDKSLKELNLIASDLNVNLLLENTGDSRPAVLLLNDEMHIELCEKYKMIYLTVDLVHYNSFFRDTEEFESGLLKLMPYIKNLHFADINGREHRHLPLGYGDLNFKQDLLFAVKNGYKENFIIEETVEDYFNYEYLNAGMKFKLSL